MNTTTIDLFDTEAATGELTDSDLELLDILEKIYRASDKIAIKKLAKNDRAWAWDPKEGKQDGVYITQEFRSHFFPSDDALKANEVRPHILEVLVPIIWPQSKTHRRNARYVRYTNKGSETHLTRLPKDLFATTGPASLLVMGRTKRSPELELECVLVDSNSAVYSMVEAKFDLRPDFLVGLFEPPQASIQPKRDEDELQVFIDEAIYAISQGTLSKLLEKYAKMPSPEYLSTLAQTIWKKKNPGKNLNPLTLNKPGDTVQEIVAHIEFDLYRKYEVRTRGSKLIEILLGDGKTPSVNSLITKLVRDFGNFYSEMLNAAQQRKARVGAGFETHIRALLVNGEIPFAEQRVVSSLRPDFVLPSLAMYESSSPNALVLSAKTTLRERWKQVVMEKRGCPIFLATMDERVSLPSVKKMREHDIYLVVPEAFKAKGQGQSAIVDFAKEQNVLSFSEFFCNEISQRRAHW
ncbi:MAG: hypothetical protein CFE38_04270 [Comamonadaceae bacterium PBBC1]|nr:MAG: hypothetical protein CFE38_04270 [Comamonadaceae bacterium PBBC1]